jgi:hypothetical protein
VSRGFDKILTLSACAIREGYNCSLCLSITKLAASSLPVNDLYLQIMLGCAHEQKAHGAVDMGGQQNAAVFMTLVGLTKLFEA